MTLLCALTSKPLGDKESEYAKKSGPRRLHQNERLGVRRFDTFFPIEQVEPNNDRQGIGNKLGHIIFYNSGEKECAIKDNKPFEETREEDGMEDVRTKNVGKMKDREALTPPKKMRKKLRKRC